MSHPCWVATCPYPATMWVQVSAIRFPGERYRRIAVCDHHGRHFEGTEMPLALVPAEPAPAPEKAARPAPIKRVSRR